MNASVEAYEQPERTLRQVRLDCLRAVVRARLCPERSVVTRLDLVDHYEETESQFGSQLWFFEGKGFDEDGTGHDLYGVVEYSIEFGLHEFIEDGVFDSASQRDRFLRLYRREVIRPTLRHPAHRWLLVGMLSTALMTSAIFAIRTLVL